MNKFISIVFAFIATLFLQSCIIPDETTDSSNPFHIVKIEQESTPSSSRITIPKSSTSDEEMSSKIDLVRRYFAVNLAIAIKKLEYERDIALDKFVREFDRIYKNAKEKEALNLELEKYAKEYRKRFLLPLPPTNQPTTPIPPKSKEKSLSPRKTGERRIVLLLPSSDIPRARDVPVVPNLPSRWK